MGQQSDTDRLREGMGLESKKSDTSSAEVEGRVERATGTAKEEVGRATGNRALEVDGAEERAEGVAKESLGEAGREVQEAIEDLGDTARKE